MEKKNVIFFKKISKKTSEAGKLVWITSCFFTMLGLEDSSIYWLGFKGAKGI